MDSGPISGIVFLARGYAFLKENRFTIVFSEEEIKILSNKKSISDATLRRNNWAVICLSNVLLVSQPAPHAMQKSPAYDVAYIFYH